MPRDRVFSRKKDCAPARTPALQSEAPETRCCVPGVAVLGAVSPVSACPRCRQATTRPCMIPEYSYAQIRPFTGPVSPVANMEFRPQGDGRAHVRKVLERISSRNSLSTCSFQRYSAVARLQFHTPTHHVCRTGKQLCSAERIFSPHLWSASVLQFGKAMRTSLPDFRCPSKASFSSTASPVTADPSHQAACCCRTRIPN